MGTIEDLKRAAIYRANQLLDERVDDDKIVREVERLGVDRNSAEGVLREARAERHRSAAANRLRRFAAMRLAEGATEVEVVDDFVAFGIARELASVEVPKIVSALKVDATRGPLIKCHSCPNMIRAFEAYFDTSGRICHVCYNRSRLATAQAAASVALKNQDMLADALVGLIAGAATAGLHGPAKTLTKKALTTLPKRLGELIDGKPIECPKCNSFFDDQYGSVHRCPSCTHEF